SRRRRSLAAILTDRVNAGTQTTEFFILSSLAKQPLTASPMSYLIDGYNLLYALGVLPNSDEPGSLQKSRVCLLQLLRSALPDEGTGITVVFDAANAPAGAVEVFNYQGIQVRFAIHEEQADDLIEAMIADEQTPSQLTVVSND